MTDRNFPALQQVAEQSWLWRAISAVTQTAQMSWANSGTTRTIGKVKTRVSAMSDAERIRLFAMTIAWAMAGYAATLFIVPPYVRPGIPASFVLVAAVLPLIVSMNAEGVAVSWRESSLRAALRK